MKIPGTFDQKERVRERTDRKKERLQNQLDKSGEKGISELYHESIREDDGESPNLSVSLKDIDKTILYQFQEKFNFEINQNGESVRVPTIWDNREDWEWVKEQNQLTTLQNRIAYPLIVIDRTDVKRNEDLGGHNNLFQGEFVGSQKFSQQNKYDDLKKLGREPVEENYVVRVPRYVDVSYSLKVMTEKRHQMNEIQERLSFKDKSYWGDSSFLLLNASIDGLGSETVNESDDSRYVEMDTTIEVNGYILPDDVEYESTARRIHSVAEVVVDEQIVSEEELKKKL